MSINLNGEFTVKYSDYSSSICPAADLEDLLGCLGTDTVYGLSDEYLYYAKKFLMEAKSEP